MQYELTDIGWWNDINILRVCIYGSSVTDLTLKNIYVYRLTSIILLTARSGMINLHILASHHHHYIKQML